MRVLFLHFGKLNVNSVIQAFHLGEELTAEGVEVTLCGKGPAGRIAEVGEPSFDCITYDELDRRLRAWSREPARDDRLRLDPARDRPAGDGAGGRGPRLPLRGPPRGQRGAPALRGAAAPLRTSSAACPAERLDELCGEDFIHPAHYPRLLEGAAGVTVITERAQRVQLRRPAAPPGAARGGRGALPPGPGARA